MTQEATLAQLAQKRPSKILAQLNDISWNDDYIPGKNITDKLCPKIALWWYFVGTPECTESLRILAEKKPIDVIKILSSITNWNAMPEKEPDIGKTAWWLFLVNLDVQKMLEQLSATHFNELCNAMHSIMDNIDWNTAPQAERDELFGITASMLFISSRVGFLLLQELAKKNIEKLITFMRRIDWNKSPPRGNNMGHTLWLSFVMNDEREIIYTMLAKQNPKELIKIMRRVNWDAARVNGPLAGKTALSCFVKKSCFGRDLFQTWCDAITRSANADPNLKDKDEATLFPYFAKAFKEGLTNGRVNAWLQRKHRALTKNRAVAKKTDPAPCQGQEASEPEEKIIEDYNISLSCLSTLFSEHDESPKENPDKTDGCASAHDERIKSFSRRP